jgi:hypothetical protein
MAYFGVTAVVIATLFQISPGAKVAPISPRASEAVLRRAAEIVGAAEPQWRFVPGVCNCPPLMDEQVGVAVAHGSNPWAPKGQRPFLPESMESEV